MGWMDGLFDGFLGGLGKKISQWIPSKEEVIRRKIDTYEKQLKEIESQKCTPILARKHTDIKHKLREERKALERYLTSNR